MRPAAMSRARVRVISRDDEAIAPEGLAFAGAGGGGSVAETFLGGHAGGVPGRGEAEEQRGEAGGEEEKGEDAGVDVNVFSVEQRCRPGNG